MFQPPSMAFVSLDLLLGVDVGALGCSMHLDFVLFSSCSRGILSRQLTARAPGVAIPDRVKQVELTRRTAHDE